MHLSKSSIVAPPGFQGHGAEREDDVARPALLYVRRPGVGGAVAEGRGRPVRRRVQRRVRAGGVVQLPLHVLVARRHVEPVEFLAPHAELRPREPGRWRRPAGFRGRRSGP
eukprot:4783058-Pyramimonas_sp.AAC.1